MSSDYYKQGAASRRDARNAKDPEPETGSVKLPSSKKDKKHFCKGKKDVPHKPVCRKYNDVKNMSTMSKYYENARILVCEACGKDLATYYPRWEKEKPDWVTE